MERNITQLGDYVLATKYHDGDPQDSWAVGFYDHEEGRHYVVDSAGQQMRGNGFRRVSKISEERGALLLRNAREIELSGRSMWGWKRAPMLVVGLNHKVRGELWNG